MATDESSQPSIASFSLSRMRLCASGVTKAVVDPASLRLLVNETPRLLDLRGLVVGLSAGVLVVDAAVERRGVAAGWEGGTGGAGLGPGRLLLRFSLLTPIRKRTKNMLGTATYAPLKLLWCSLGVVLVDTTDGEAHGIQTIINNKE